MRLWIGARGADLKSEARGVMAATAGDADSPLAGGPLALVGDAVEVPSPTWLAPHPTLDVVYAALEGQGRIAAFRRTGEATLAPLGPPVEAGEAVCHVAVAPDGSRLVGSCWGDGRVVHLALDAAGRLGRRTEAAPSVDPYDVPRPAGDAAADALAGQGDVADLRALVEGGVDASQLAAMLAGSTPNPAVDAGIDDILALLGQSRDPFDDPAVRDILRPGPGGPASPLAGAMPLGGAAAAAAQGDEPRVSRAHAALFLSDGRIATTDLGYDLVRFWRPAADGLTLDHEVALPFGAGPRHMVLHPGGHLFVVTEFTSEVFVLSPGPDGRWALRSGVPASPGALAGDAGAELCRSRDGRFLYAGLRGSDTIAVLAVRGEGDRLEHVALVESGVRRPRHHVVLRDALLVAGQASNEIASLPVDDRTGVPGRLRHRLAVPTPQHILPAR